MASPTTEQKKIIDNINANNMVIAAPGSGKSFTLIQGVVAILAKSPYARIAMVTFTRAATNSLEEKLKKKLNAEQYERVMVNTFHGFVKMQLDAVGWPGKMLISSAQRSVIHRSIKEAGVICKYPEAEFSIDAIGREMDPDIISVRHTRQQIHLFNVYQSLCQKDNVADLNALSRFVVSQMHSGMMRPLDLTHLIVDEVQDTDSIQYAWIAQHTRAGVNTSIVGDDDQAIYSFRASGGVKIFQQFEKNFRPNIFYLNMCFRCEPEILSTADALITKNVYRYAKDLRSSKKGGGKVTFQSFVSMEDQIQAVLKLIEKDPYGWAILSRGNAHLDQIESFITQPVIRFGGKSFWDEKETSDVLHLMAFFRHASDKRLMKRVLALFGEHEQILDQVHDRMKSRKVTFGDVSLPAESSTESRTLHTHFRRFMENSHDKAEITRRIGNLVKWMEMASIKMKTNKGTPSLSRIALDTCQQWAEKSGWENMINRAAAMCLGPKLKNEEYTPDKVVLSTLHGSKGLEWPRVIILSCNADQIPSKRSVGSEAIEEERRLLFVGMTRAERELYVMWYGAPSFFLNECGEEKVKAAAINHTQEKSQENI
ncbi:IncHI-type conjugal transfer helicase TrhI [Lelliottia amnigena]|uniref:IncHI-type conjugal transfer helicase TrhI n=1 Tax=Lelliottia TaxID=1330545 RepID=UPI00192CE0B3|nr:MULTISPECIES: IncHI-type conjugal transfer helicase TrhI [Lelliottia]MBL5885684.1 IncHI-type conjugal transfer helicase TrhI [Lelliottia aquatilis]MBL5923263.1 IncHI-type conjugal transfer helicase TrhI [Lelliottia amnigena]MBL5932172.1 IncHI-type conjugal transfer helicase TrhI [Lelliottia amnigena]